MKVVYTGRQVEVSPAIRSEVEEKLNKVHAILGPRLELEARFVLARERRGSYSAEITLRARHHSLVAVGTNYNALSSAQEAAERLEKQALRNRNRWREIRRQPKVPVNVEAAAPPHSEIEAHHIPPARETALVRSAGANS